MKAGEMKKNKRIRRILMGNMVEVKDINKRYKGEVWYEGLKEI